MPSASSTASTPTQDTTFASRPYDRASLVCFDAGHGPQLAWHTYAQVDSQHVYEDVVDAASGDLLFRQNAVDFAGRGLHWWYLPSYSAQLPAEQRRHDVDRTRSRRARTSSALGWLGAGATTLSGNNAHVYADYDDDDTPTEVEILPAADAVSEPETGPTRSSRARASTAPATISVLLGHATT